MLYAIPKIDPLAFLGHGTTWRFPWEPEPSNLPTKEPSEVFPSPEDEANMSQFFVFSPFISPVGDQELEMMILLLAVVKLAKTPEGLKVLRDLGVKYLDTLGKTLIALEHSSSSNWLTALINQKLSLRVMRRLGLISATEAAGLEASYNWIFNAMYTKGFIVDTVSALTSFGLGGGVQSILGKTSE